jgi:hypothetical protein
MPLMNGKHRVGDRVNVEVSTLEFVVGGNTIWIHSPKGATVLRIQTPPGKKISIHEGCQNIVAHADIRSADAIEVCLP